MLMAHRYDPTPSIFLKTTHGYHPVTDSCGYLSPFMIVTAIAIKATDGDNIFLPPAALTDGKRI